MNGLDFYKNTKKKCGTPFAIINTMRCFFLEHKLKAYFYAILLSVLAICGPARAQYGQCSQFLGPELTIVLSNDISDILAQDYFGSNNWAKEYITLTGKESLINQSDPRLGSLGLLVEKGGLCGPTCLANVYIAKDSLTAKTPSDYWSQQAPQLIHRILNRYNEHVLGVKGLPYVDPRMGTFLEYYMSEGSSILREMGIRARNLDVKSPDHIFYQIRRKDSIIVGQVEFPQSEQLSGAHAIMILGADSKNKRLILADPNEPNKILITDYVLDGYKLKFFLWPDLYHGVETLVTLESAYLFTF